jgi:DNA (cytosine-5)-methyltransferase 1
MEIWDSEPSVGRVANGVSNRAHRLKGIGNAVVPQIPELIGNAIMADRAYQANARVLIEMNVGLRIADN